MVAEGYGLGHLQMGKAGHDGLGMGLGFFGKRQLQVFQLSVEMVNRVPDIEAEIRSDLVIARARRMQTAGGFADNVLQALLDIHVNVFKRCRKGERACFDLGLNLVEAAGNFPGVGLRNDALLGQHCGMGFRACNVLGIEALVKADGSIDLLHDGVGSGFEPAAPHFIGHWKSLDTNEYAF